MYELCVGLWVQTEVRNLYIIMNGLRDFFYYRFAFSATIEDQEELDSHAAEREYSSDLMYIVDHPD